MIIWLGCSILSQGFWNLQWRHISLAQPMRKSQWSHLKEETFQDGNGDRLLDLTLTWHLLVNTWSHIKAWAPVEELHQFNRFSDTPKTMLVERYDNMCSSTVAIFPQQSSFTSLLSTFHCFEATTVIVWLDSWWSLCVGRLWWNVPKTLLASVNISPLPLFQQN